MLIALLALLAQLLCSAHASAGDRSMYFSQCLTHCHDDCDNLMDASAATHLLQPQFRFVQLLQKFWHESVFAWSCKEECKYGCMWRTVDYFHSHKKPTPQFFGKWPFHRILSIQEPASAIASVMNLASYLYMMLKFQTEVSPSAPLYGVWFTYGWIAIFTWIFSTIFHCRDLPFTEKMDYMSAFAVVAFTMYIYLIRCVVGWADSYRVWSTFAFVTAFYLYHAYSMCFVKFDYGYNMTINLSLGVAASIGLLLWCSYNWRQMPHVTNCAIFVVLVDSLVLLEVLDFPPIFWTLDAHALWHFATVPLPFFWFKFAIDDCRYLERTKEVQRNYRLQETSQGKKLIKSM